MATLPSARIKTGEHFLGESAARLKNTERLNDPGVVASDTEAIVASNAAHRNANHPHQNARVSIDHSATDTSTPRSIEIQTNTLYATTTIRGRSLLCTRGNESCKPSKFVMFQVSGAIGMILFYLAWCEIFYRMRGVKHGPIVSWTVAYACSVLWQHLLNRTLVWTDLQQGYWESLGGMCVVYFFSLILSSVLNVLFVEVLSIAANFAFFVTAVFTGAVNYVVIAKCAIGDDNQESKELEDKEWEERDIVVDMATNMVSGIQLPSIEMPMPAVELWGKKIQQVTKYHKKWANDHQV